MSGYCFSSSTLLLLLVSSSNFNSAHCAHSVDDKLDFISNTLVKLVNEFETFNKRLMSIESSLIRTQIEADNRKEIRDISGEIRKLNYVQAGRKLLELKNNSLIADIVHDTYENSSGNVSIILDFADSLKNGEPKVRLLCALQTEMHSKGNRNPFELISLAMALDCDHLGVTTEELKNKTQTSLNSVIEDVKDASARFLESALIAQNYNQNMDVERLASALFQFRINVSNAVMDQLVNSAFRVVSAEDILKSISSHKQISQVTTGLLAVFNRFNNAGNLNNKTTLILTAHLRQLQLRSDYKLLDRDRLSDVEKVIQSLPTCARNLLFSPKVCLWNKQWRRYMQASSVEYNRKLRKIFMVEESDANDGVVWNVQKIGRDFYFSNNDTHESLYASELLYKKESRYVFNWIPGRNTDDQSAWNFELDGDYCYIMSTYYDQYLYASDDWSGPNNYAFLWNAEDPVKYDAYKWQVRNCDDSVTH